jgi:hypothetical protein
MQLTAYAVRCILSVVMKVLTTDEFAEWFAAQDDALAEDVATALDLVEQLGPERAPPGSRESLLWYEHPSVTRFRDPRSLAADLDGWSSFRDYALQVLKKLESPRFSSRLSRLPSAEARVVLRSIERIRREADPRFRWALKASDAAFGLRSAEPVDACAAVRRLYFEALGAAGFKVTDVPAHSLALREFSRRMPAPAFRLLYGVNVRQETALVVLGERLDRTYYGDSVRRAEAMWRQFLEGTLPAASPLPLR